MVSILGLSFHHDAGATLINGDKVVAAVNEERFTRQKHDATFPFQAIDYCLDAGAVDRADLDALAVPMDNNIGMLADILEDPEVTDVSVNPPSRRERLARTAAKMGRFADRPGYLAGRIVERAFRPLMSSEIGASVPSYLMGERFDEGTRVICTNHHEAHARTAYHGSGMDDALVVTADGIGNRYSTTVWDCQAGEMEPLRRWQRGGSLGWFYGIVTEALGWWIGNGEGKTMGLASYGQYDDDVANGLETILPRYEDGELVDDVRFSIPSSYTLRGTDHWSFEESDRVERLINNHGREDVAATAQRLLEEQIIEIVGPWLERTGHDCIATAGGVFLNVRVNNRVIRKVDPESYFIYPNAGDGGLPTGAAYAAAVAIDPSFDPDPMTNAYLGPDITGVLENELDKRKLTWARSDDIVERVADRLADGDIVAWCQGQMEYGPRALGNRSILIDPTRDDSMDRVNRSVKFRESWRPFAPSIKEEAVDDYLVDPVYDPFMITSFDVQPERRDEIPAVTHVDGTTRPQVVRRSVNERYWRLLDAFEDRTGTPVLLNTSYNLSGDPIVCDAADAVETFYGCGLDAVAVGEYLLEK